MKKILSIILSLCMLLSMATTAFAAYGEHEHKLMKMANMNSHYEECQVCFELFNAGEHTFKEGKCYDRFTVKGIGYTNGVITGLEIMNQALNRITLRVDLLVG